MHQIPMPAPDGPGAQGQNNGSNGAGDGSSEGNGSSQVPLPELMQRMVPGIIQGAIGGTIREVTRKATAAVPRITLKTTEATRKTPPALPKPAQTKNQGILLEITAAAIQEPAQTRNGGIIPKIIREAIPTTIQVPAPTTMPEAMEAIITGTTQTTIQGTARVISPGRIIRILITQTIIPEIRPISIPETVAEVLTMAPPIMADRAVPHLCPWVLCRMQSGLCDPECVPPGCFWEVLIKIH